MTGRPIRALLVEDDLVHATWIREMLRGTTCAVKSVQTLAAGLECLGSDGIDIVLLDLRLPDSQGLETFNAVHSRAPEVPVIVVTVCDDETLAVSAVREGAQDYLIKGQVNGALLMRAMRYAIERQRTEKALAIANAQLQRNNDRLAQLAEAAQRFVDDVSHEFRTPLAVIKEFTAILADGLGGPVSEQQAEYLRMTGTAVQDLAQMVDDLLDTSRLKAGTLRVDRRRCTAAEILQSVRPMLMRRAAAKNIALLEQIRPDLSDVFADKEKAGRALINLAVNAIKFSPESGRVTLWAGTDEDGRVQLGVTDQGPGVSGEDMKVIFDRFKQAGETAQARTKGFGLGLHIAKELVRLNLGKLHVYSQPGRGSNFSFTLPRYDKGEIVQRYFEMLAMLESDTPVVALEVTVAEPASALAQVRGFLISTCRPMDLVLDDDDGRRLILLGRSDTPEQWAGRIAAARAKSMQNDPLLRIPEFQVAAAGTWAFPAESVEARSAALELLRGRTEVAQESACD